MEEKKLNRTVWKFGSRWSDEGDPGTQIADSVFKKYNIAFANTNAVLDIKKNVLPLQPLSLQKKRKRNRNQVGLTSLTR